MGYHFSDIYIYSEYQLANFLAYLPKLTNLTHLNLYFLWLSKSIREGFRYISMIEQPQKNKRIIEKKFHYLM
jgi:hypothetical protein